MEVPHDESSIDFTQGNLRAALQKRCVFDKKLASIVSTCSRNATFLSPEVENRMIGCAATVLLRDVTALLHDAGFFSVIADGTSDISRCEQLSVTLCFENEGRIDEVFVGFVPMTVQNAEAVGYKAEISRPGPRSPQCRWPRLRWCVGYVGARERCSGAHSS